MITQSRRFWLLLAMLIPSAIAGWVLAGSQMSGEDPAQSGSLLVVLGGGVEGNRERLACDIWAAGLVAGPVILTGGSLVDSIGDRARFLDRCGIPAARIRKWEEPSNTYEEMRSLQAYLSTPGMGKAIVVSDAPHMPRLRFLRKALGLEGRVVFRESRLAVGPNAVSILRAVMFWTREPAAYLYYRLKYAS